MSKKVEIQHAWYSAKADAMGLSVVWLGANGKRVTATCVTIDRDGNGYLFDDRVYMGEVLCCIRGRALTETDKFFQELL